ncbi:MAG: DUF4143 domain-containing protein, partial [Elusimicrobiota bacterium]|nr:DUF4143 domain-containing protein [Elusimicrobiota bacterium]
LYFYDVGLAAHLLGIENSAQVATHPLRGSLFENMVVTEALKHRLNEGKRSDLSFYRDSSGLEVDLVASGGGLRPLEIKSGETLNSDYFKNLEKFLKLFPAAAGRAGLVYGGEDKGERNGIHFFPVTGLEFFLGRQGLL